MQLFDTKLWSNFVNEGELPKMEVETYVTDETIIKLTIAVLFLIVVAFVLARLHKNA